MTELSFLIDLLLNHKIPKKTKDAIQSRIKDIESNQIFTSPQRAQTYQQPQRPVVAQQSPSMQAKVEAMEREKEMIANGEIPPQTIPVGPPPTTAAAAQALNLRASLINGALKEAGGNFEPGRISARKF